jgi:hypothetical protein
MQEKTSQVPGDNAEWVELFISHPHAYKEFADILSTTIEGWSNASVKVHQTSDAGRNPLAVGEAIRPQLEQYLRSSSVVLVVYVNDKLAPYCMWEAGVAFARGDKPLGETRVVVFQLGNESPSVFKEDLLVKLTLESIENFTYDFHRNKEFFHTLGEAIAPVLADSMLKQRAKNLFDDLMKVHKRFEPPPVPPPPPKPETHSRWITFKIALDNSHAQEIYKIANPEDKYEEEGPTALEKAIELGKKKITEECVIEEYPSNLLAHFDMSEVPKGTKFVTFYYRWRTFVRGAKMEEYLDLDWWNELCTQITLAIAAYGAREIQMPFKSVREESTWYLPVVTHKTTIPENNKIVLSISLIRIPKDGSVIKIDAGKLLHDKKT